jgi:hypothetical protein
MTRPQPPNDGRDWRPLQFSIREVFLLVTVVAIFFVEVRLLDNDIRFALKVVFFGVLAWCYVRVLMLGRGA